MKVIIAGSRGITDYGVVQGAFLDAALIQTEIEIVSGCARGVDRLGEMLAEDYGYAVRLFPAEWDVHGKSAGYIRNADMANYADILIAVWDGKSKGTKHMITTMCRLNKAVFIYDPTTGNGIWR